MDMSKMGCDYFFDEKGNFELKFHGDEFDNRTIIIKGKPNGRIYMDIIRGTDR